MAASMGSWKAGSGKMTGAGERSSGGGLLHVWGPVQGAQVCSQHASLRRARSHHAPTSSIGKAYTNTKGKI